MKKEGKKILVLGLSLILFASLILAVNFVSAESIFGYSPSVDFFTHSVICQKTETSARWVNSSTGAVLSDATLNCSLYSSITGESCCPSSNNICRSNGRCDGVGSFCSDFNDSFSCANAGLAIAEASVPSTIQCNHAEPYTDSEGNYCFNVTECQCFWNEGSCLASADYYTNCTDPDGSSHNSNNGGKCFWNFLKRQDNCNSSLNNLVYRAIANWTIRPGETANQEAKAKCVDYERTIKCPYTAKLSFISDAGVTIAVILLVIVYIYLYLKRKKAIQNKIIKDSKNYKNSKEKPKVSKKKKL